MLNKRLQREIKELTNNPVINCSAGPIDENNLKLWKGTIFGAEDTPYYGGIFEVTILFSDEYPYKPPRIKFITPIYHCNINSKGEICLDILKNEWSPSYTIGKLLLSICSLLSEPNTNDPLVPEIAELYLKNKDVHDAYVREYVLKYAN
jgi:ubiquitin-conjugating enzyme E2 D/E